MAVSELQHLAVSAASGPVRAVREAEVISPPKPKTRRRQKIARPPMYRVVMLNDDYTPMEFVVEVLMQIFAMPEPKAVDVMLTVHNQGRAVVGVFSYDIAETKAEATMAAARQYEHPLRCQLEPD